MSAKRTALLASLGALALMANASNAGTNTPKGAGTTVISLDGHCDVLTLTVFSWHQAGMSQVCNGVMTGVGAGMEGKAKGLSSKVLSIGENYSPGPAGTVYLWNFQYPLKTGGTWSIYSTYGADLMLVDSGTYTVTSAEAPRDPHEGPSVLGVARK